MLLIKIIAENKSFEHFVRILRAYDELQPCLHELAGWNWVPHEHRQQWFDDVVFYSALCLTGIKK